MANESADSKAQMSSPSSSSSAGDSYIGSIISLTSKYEIRYEGVLYHLNPQDSTLGLKNVRSFGTEGRKKDGPQIPASDKVYEYILFRGSDIKDLQVKSSSPSQVEESIHNDPAIIQSQSASEPSSLPKSSAPSAGTLIESSPYMEASTLNMKSYPNVVPSHQSGAQARALGPSQTAQETMYSSHAMSSPWSGYNTATDDHAYGRQPIPSTTTSFPTLPNVPEVPFVQAPTNIALSSSSNSLAPLPSVATTNSVNPSLIPTLTPEQLSANAENAFSSTIKPPLFSYPTSVPNQLSMPSLHLLGQKGIRSETPENVSMFTGSMKMQSAHSLSYSASSLVDSGPGSFLRQSQSVLTPDHLPQPRPSGISPEQNLYPDHMDMALLNSASSSSLYLNATAAAQVLSLPPQPPQPPAQQYTEEFDFDAMNEKFKKDEVWGYLGKAKQKDNMERIENKTSVENLGKEEDGGFVAEADPKVQPAYKKDDFFDTISCNSTAQRLRNVQNRVPQRMRHDYEQMQPGYGGYVSGRGYQQDPYSWGRGNNFGGRGRGGYPRWY